MSFVNSFHQQRAVYVNNWNLYKFRLPHSLDTSNCTWPKTKKIQGPALKEVNGDNQRCDVSVLLCLFRAFRDERFRASGNWTLDFKYKSSVANECPTFRIVVFKRIRRHLQLLQHSIIAVISSLDDMQVYLRVHGLYNGCVHLPPSNLYEANLILWWGISRSSCHVCVSMSRKKPCASFRPFEAVKDYRE